MFRSINDGKSCPAAGCSTSCTLCYVIFTSAATFWATTMSSILAALIMLQQLTHSATECKESKQCAPAKHHFDECVERVHNAQEASDGKKHAHEDCVEECKSGVLSSQTPRVKS
jgi:hypothetical protein